VKFREKGNLTPSCQVSRAPRFSSKVWYDIVFADKNGKKLGANVSKRLSEGGGGLFILGNYCEGEQNSQDGPRINQKDSHSVMVKKGKGKSNAVLVFTLTGGGRKNAPFVI